MSTFYVNFMFQLYIQQQNESVSAKHSPLSSLYMERICTQKELNHV